MKNSILELCYYTGISSLFKALNRDKIVVLMYHGVMSDSSSIDSGDWLQVKAHEFRKQMAWLKKHYNVCSLESILKEQLPPSPKPRIVITFDDGYANNLQYAYPILQEFKLPATIFITTGMIGSNELFWWDKVYLATRGKMSAEKRDAFTERCKQLKPQALEDYIDNEFLPAHGITDFSDEAYEAYRPLTHKELEQLAASDLITLGSHTRNHEILTQISDNQVNRTIQKSIMDLKPFTDNVKFFAAPNGYYKPHHIDIFKQAGFKAAVNTERKIYIPTQIDPYEIPRIGVGRGYTQRAFASLISGFWEPLENLLHHIIKR